MRSRTLLLTELERRLRHFPVLALLGARQVGKTTLAQQLAAAQEGPATRFDLEDPRDLARLADPMLVLEPLRGLVVLDEVQRLPNLFPVLRVLADRPGTPARFLVLGSASPELLRQTSESLAGRISHFELDGFRQPEVEKEELDPLWVRGSFPRAFLAPDEATSFEWRREFIRTYLERDLAQLGFGMPPEAMRRFWTMLAHYHGQTWNGAELARAFGMAERTVRRYLDALCSTFMVRRLEPWHTNLAKRQVKAPKVYLADSGLLHALLDIEDRDQLIGHPKVGASWEGFAIEQVIATLGLSRRECYSWGLHSGAELDLLVRRGGRSWGFEFKLTSAPRTTRSMRSAIDTLGLDGLFVVHAGDSDFPLAEGIRAVPLSGLAELVTVLRARE